MELLFPFSQYWWSYAVFTGFVLLLLVIDLGVFHRRAHVVSFRESLAWSVVWVALALLFNLAVYGYTAAAHGAETGRRIAFEFLTGYIVEKSLAIDNIFVFVLVFASSGFPRSTSTASWSSGFWALSCAGRPSSRSVRC
jgi:tellurite resistance protein TerC